MDGYLEQLTSTSNYCEKGIPDMEEIYTFCLSYPSMNLKALRLCTQVLQETNTEYEKVYKNARQVLAVTECLATFDGIVNNAPAAQDPVFCSATTNLRRILRRFEAVGTKVRLLSVEVSMQEEATIEIEEEQDGSGSEGSEGSEWTDGSDESDDSDGSDGARAPEIWTSVEENWHDNALNQS